MTRQEKRGGLVRCGFLIALGLVVPLAYPAPAAAAPLAGGWLASSAIGQAKYGTIKGRLVWGGDKAPPAVLLEAKGKASKDPNICATSQDIFSHALEVDAKTKGVAYGFAYVVRPKGTNPEAVQELISTKPKVEMDQKNCDFVPHSVAIHQDQTLVMKSSDPTNHNVRLSGFANPGINQNVCAQGQLNVRLVADRVPLTVQCDIHSWMKGYVMVFDHPFFAVTGPDGSFEIKGVPAGGQNIIVWQEKVGYVTPNGRSGMPVKVTAGEVADVGEIKIDPAKANR